MLRSLLQPTKQGFFLTSPRGPGNSACPYTTSTDAHLIDLLAQESYQRTLCSPVFIPGELRAVQSEPWVIIDEMQRSPGHCRP